DQRRGERRRIDRAAQPRPQIGHSADMVLMAMGEDEPDKVAPPLLDEADVRHDDVDARRTLVAEGDAEIDHQPLAGKTVEAEVHAELAGGAERQEQQLAVRAPRAHRGAPWLRRWISTRPRMVISGSWRSITGVALAKSGARPPVATTISCSPNSARMRATSPSIRPT